MHRSQTRGICVVAAIVLLAGLINVVPALATSGPTVGAADVYPVVQGLSAPLGDVTITEGLAGQLTVGDVITFRFSDAANGSTFHLTSAPAVGGSHGLSASAAIASSSGTLKDEVLVTVQTASSGNFPATLTLTRLNASIDVSAAVGNDQVRISDASAIVAASGSPATIADANAVGTALRATFSAVSKPTVSTTGFDQVGGDLTITEPAKSFFKTNDVLTFTIRDSLGSGDTVGLAGPPTASGGGMLVSVTGLSGGPVQPNDTGFKVSIDQQDASNGSASTLQISNLVFNTGQAPVGQVTISAAVTTGASTEYIYPGRVADASVGGNTTTTSAGSPVLQIGTPAQPAANLTIIESPGTLKATTTFSLTVQEAGVTFSSAPLASVTGGDLQLASATATLDGSSVTATWTVSGASTTTTTIVIGPINYDVASTGPNPGDGVSLLAAGGTGSGFTSQAVVDAVIAPTGATLFTPVSAPSTPTSAGDVTYQETAGIQAPTGGSIALLSPYATQILAYRTTFQAIPTATVAPGSGLVLGTGTVNASALTVVTPNGPIVAPAETVTIYPVTTGSTSAASVTFSNISYHLGGLVAPGALVSTGVVDSGPSATGTNVAGNDFANAVNPAGLGSGGGTPTYQPDGQIKRSTDAAFVGGNIYNITGASQTVAGKVAPGKKITFVIQIQNDGNNSDGFTLKGTGNLSGFTVQYLQGPSGTTNITSQVVGGTYATLSVGPTAAATIRMIIKAKSTVTAGTAHAWTLLATSAGDPTKKDEVKGKVKAT